MSLRYTLLDLEKLLLRNLRFVSQELPFYRAALLLIPFFSQGRLAAGVCLDFGHTPSGGLRLSKTSQEPLIA